jgi:hypothetical protein
MRIDLKDIGKVKQHVVDGKRNEDGWTVDWWSVDGWQTGERFGCDWKVSAERSFRLNDRGRRLNQRFEQWIHLGASQTKRVNGTQLKVKTRNSAEM